MVIQKQRINIGKNVAEMFFNNSKEIAVIDLEDVEKVIQHKWYVTKYGYVRETSGKFFLHNLIMGVKGIDHINRCKLDNQKSNLRICDPSLNAFNKNIRPDNTSGCAGVNKRYGKYQAQISFQGKRITLGVFKTFEEAKSVRLDAEQKYYGVK
jgi:hypothetical protein